MGAENIELIINKKATKDEIDKAFKNQQNEDRSYNGTKDGYSGDFQTIDKVIYHLDKVFNSENEAEEYCLKHAEKWISVIAVYFKVGKPIKSCKKLEALREKHKHLSEENNAILNTKQSLTGFKTCSNCKSKINFDKKEVSTWQKNILCPVCNTDLSPKSILNKSLRITKKIKDIETKIQAQFDILKKKSQDESSEIYTLIAGWGAC